MRASRHAIIIMYTGEDVSRDVLKNLSDTLIINNIAIPELTTVVYKDEAEIANVLLRSAGEEVPAEKTPLTKAIENAVIYIGERFKESLRGANGPIGNIAMFAIELSSAVTEARRNTSFTGVGTRNELLTAIEILSTNEGTIPSSLAKKYHFTQNVVEVIKKIYNSY